jgi:hypothetical protein
MQISPANVGTPFTSLGVPNSTIINMMNLALQNYLTVSASAISLWFNINLDVT